MREVTRLRRRVLIERVFRNHGVLIAAGLFAVSLVYLALVPLSFGPLISTTHEDENSLLVNQVETRYAVAEQRALKNFLAEVRETGLDGETMDTQGRRRRALWLQDKFRQAGLISHVHDSPCGVGGDSTCYTVYAVLRAPRAEGNEALALTSVWRNELLAKPNMYGVAQLYAMALLWRRMHYFAKDILFAVGDGVGALKAYVHDYHAPAARPPHANKFLYRAGEIHIAIHVEIHSKRPDLAIIELYGHYGQMSNLDMVLVIAKSLEAQNLRVESRFGAGKWVPRRGLNGSMTTVAAARQIPLMLIDQALERQHGPHPAFKVYGIDAMSVFAIDASRETGADGSNSGSNSGSGSLKVARALEGAFASFNNLRERLHHASWIYIFISSRHVIYFATFVYIVVIMQAALPVAAYSVWLNSGLSPVELAPHEHGVAKELVESSDFTPVRRDVKGAVGVAAAATVFGCIVNFAKDDSLQAALSVAASATVYMLSDVISTRVIVSREAADMLVVAGQCLTAALGISLSLMNFGLALAFTLGTAPVWMAVALCYRYLAAASLSRAGAGAGAGCGRRRVEVAVLRVATVALHPAIVLAGIVRFAGESRSGGGGGAAGSERAPLAQAVLWCGYLPIHIIYATLLARTR